MRPLIAVLLSICMSIFLVGRGMAGAADADWRQVKGSAVDIALDDKGTAYVVASDGKVWRWDNEVFRGWRPFPGRFVRIAAGPASEIWGIDSNHRAWRYSGGRWEDAGFDGRDIAVGWTKDVAVVAPSGAVAVFDSKNTARIDLGGDAARVALESGDDVWVVGPQGRVRRHVGGEWRDMPDPPAPASDIAVGPDGSVVIACTDDRLRRWDADGSRWVTVAGRYSARGVSVGPGGLPWAVSEAGHIFASALFEAQKAAVNRAPTFRFGNYNFRKVRGKARQVAIGAGGAVFAVGEIEGEIWRWRTGTLGGWTRFPGTLARIAVDPAGAPWGIDPDGIVRRYANWSWRDAGQMGIDVAVGANGTVFVLDRDGVLQRWDGKSAWQRVPGAVPAVRVAAGPRGRPWLLTAEGVVHRFDGKAWKTETGIARAIAVGPDGEAMVVDESGVVKVFRRTQRRWDRIDFDGTATDVAMGPGDQPWLVADDGQIFASRFFKTEEETGEPIAKAEPENKKAEPVEIATTEADADSIRFKRVSGTAQDIAIGKAGHVFAVDASGNLRRWDDQRRRFDSFGKVLRRVAVDGSGNPWGIDPGGTVWRFDGSRWRDLGQKARDIAIGADESVFVADQDEGRLYRYTEADGRFQIYAGYGERVAVDPDGFPWVVDTGGAVRQCSDAGCEHMGRTGVDIDVGPDGSVVVAGSLWRYKAPTVGEKKGEWERLASAVGATNVAVGPGGWPWFVDRNRAVFASEFFETPGGVIGEDVSVTAVVAAEPTIRFIKRFTMTEAFSGNNSDTLAAGPDDVFVGYRYTAGAWSIYRWNSGSKDFERYKDRYSFGSFIRSLAVTPDGRLWYVDNGRNYYEEKKPGRGFNERSGVPTSGSADVTLVATGIDGSVFALSAEQKVYKYDAAKKKFDDFGLNGTYEWLAVDENGDPWVSDASTYRLYRYVDGKLEDPGRRQQTAMRFEFGPTGVLFVVGTDMKTVYRWNSSNRTFDEVTLKGVDSSDTWEDIAVDSDGELWLQEAVSQKVYRVK